MNCWSLSSKQAGKTLRRPAARSGCAASRLWHLLWLLCLLAACVPQASEGGRGGSGIRPVRWFERETPPEQWLWPPNPQRTDASLRGTVLSHEGAPIAGAQVCVRQVVIEHASPAVMESRCKLTSQLGEYLFLDLRAVPTQVHASADGYVPRAYRGKAVDHDESYVHLEEDSGARVIELRLRQGGRPMRGIVVSDTGRPIKGATVTIRVAAYEQADGLFVQATTDDDGRYAVWIDSSRVEGRVTAAGFAAESLHYSRGDGELRTVLIPGGIIDGRIVDAETGDPVAQVAVTASWGSDELGETGVNLSAMDGSFRLAGLVPGSVVLRVTDPRYEAINTPSLALGPGASAQAPTIAVKRVEPRIDAQLRFRRTGRPCEGGTVTLRRRPDGHEADAPSESAARLAEQVWAPVSAGGRVRVSRIEPGHYDVEARCTNFLYELEQEIVARPEHLERVVWFAQVGRNVKVMLLDVDGAPLPNMSVVAREVLPPEEDSPDAPEKFGAVSRAIPFEGVPGGYLLRGLTPGKYEVDAGPRAERRRICTFDVSEEAQRLPVVCTLPESRSVRGQLVDEFGGVVRRGRVTLYSTDPFAWHELPVEDDGSFEANFLAPAKYRVSVFAAPHGDDRLRTSKIRRGGDTAGTFAASIDLAIGDQSVTALPLVVSSSVARLEGRVVDGTGRPIAGALVSDQYSSDEDEDGRGACWSSGTTLMDGDQRMGPTDAEGRFGSDRDLDASEFYPISLYAIGPHGEQAWGAWTDPTKPVELVVQPSLDLQIRLIGAVVDGTQAMVSLWSDQPCARDSQKVRVANGTVTLGGVPAGSYSITVLTRDHGGEYRTFNHDAGERTEGAPVIEMLPRVEVSGRVVDLRDGTAVPGMRVTAEFDGGAMWIGDIEAPAGATTDDDGRFVLKRVPQGVVSFYVSPERIEGQPTHQWQTVRAVVSADGAAGKAELTLGLIATRRASDAAYGSLHFEWDTRHEIDRAEDRVVVTKVEPGGPAAKAGLTAGDELVEIDGVSVRGLDDARVWPMLNVGPRRLVHLRIRRGSVERDIAVRSTQADVEE